MYRYRAVVFDLDGTLLDTLEDLTDSVNVAMEQFGCEKKTIGQVRSYVGNGIRKLIDRCLDGGEAYPQFEEVFQAFKDDYNKNCRRKTQPYPGIVDMIRTLQEQGIKVAIVSNKADFAVKELNEYYFKEFNLVAIGEREGICRKPAPDTVFMALRELGAAKEDAVYVGDSDVDIMTAHNAGMPCISVLWGFRDRNFLNEHGASAYAQDAEELLHMLLEKEESVV